MLNDYLAHCRRETSLCPAAPAERVGVDTPLAPPWPAAPAGGRLTAWPAERRPPRTVLGGAGDFFCLLGIYGKQFEEQWCLVVVMECGIFFYVQML